MPNRAILFVVPADPANDPIVMEGIDSVPPIVAAPVTVALVADIEPVSDVFPVAPSMNATVVPPAVARK